VVAVVYLIAAFLLLLHRLKLVVVVALLLVAAPLAIAAGALPFPDAQRFFRWWLSTFLGATFVQVLQATCLGLGAALLSAPLVPGEVEGPAQGVLAASVGVGAILAALSLPGMLLGTLARAQLAPGVVGTTLQAAAMLAGIGLAWPAGPAIVTPVTRAVGAFAGPPPAGATVAPIARGGYVGSLLAGAPSPPPVLALPPPEP
jgi:hypothetical protein